MASHSRPPSSAWSSSAATASCSAAQPEFPPLNETLHPFPSLASTTTGILSHSNASKAAKRREKTFHGHSSFSGGYAAGSGMATGHFEPYPSRSSEIARRTIESGVLVGKKSALPSYPSRSSSFPFSATIDDGPSSCSQSTASSSRVDLDSLIPSVAGEDQEPQGEQGEEFQHSTPQVYGISRVTYKVVKRTAKARGKQRASGSVLGNAAEGGAGDQTGLRDDSIDGRTPPRSEEERRCWTGVPIYQLAQLQRASDGLSPARLLDNSKEAQSIILSQPFASPELQRQCPTHLLDDLRSLQGRYCFPLDDTRKQIEAVLRLRFERALAKMHLLTAFSPLGAFQRENHDAQQELPQQAPPGTTPDHHQSNYNAFTAFALELRTATTPFWKSAQRTYLAMAAHVSSLSLLRRSSGGDVNEEEQIEHQSEAAQMPLHLRAMETLHLLLLVKPIALPHSYQSSNDPAFSDSWSSTDRTHIQTIHRALAQHITPSTLLFLSRANAVQNGADSRIMASLVRSALRFARAVCADANLHHDDEADHQSSAACAADDAAGQRYRPHATQHRRTITLISTSILRAALHASTHTRARCEGALSIPLSQFVLGDSHSISSSQTRWNYHGQYAVDAPDANTTKDPWLYTRDVRVREIYAVLDESRQAYMRSCEPGRLRAHGHAHIDGGSDSESDERTHTLRLRVDRAAVWSSSMGGMALASRSYNYNQPHQRYGGISLTRGSGGEGREAAEIPPLALRTAHVAIEWVHEEAHPGRGPRREWFEQIGQAWMDRCLSATNPDAAGASSSNSTTETASSAAGKNTQLARVLAVLRRAEAEHMGSILALAFAHAHIVPFDLPLAFFRALIGAGVGMDEEDDNRRGGWVQQMLMMQGDHDEEEDDDDVRLPVTLADVEIADPALAAALLLRIQTDNDSRIDADAIYTQAASAVFGARAEQSAMLRLARRFRSSLGPDVSRALRTLHPSELRARLCGSSASLSDQHEIRLPPMRLVGWETEEDYVLLEKLREFFIQNAPQMLLFITGSSRLPTKADVDDDSDEEDDDDRQHQQHEHGETGRDGEITLHLLSDAAFRQHVPWASTCAQVLFVPRMAPSELEGRLQVSLSHAAGFGML